MFSSSYHFVTRWRVEGTPQEVYTILDEPLDLPRWWPSVYLDVREEQTPRGQVYHLLTKGWLPYTLRWEFRRTEKVPFERMALEARGDFVGAGVWTIRADGRCVEVVYDWRVRADKPVLRYLSFLLRPIFAPNHRWAMTKGEESLRLELARRRAQADEERRRIPAPPGPTTTSSVPLLAGLIGVLAVIGMAAQWLL
ncbi:MAG: polyketide cyclase [Gemmataceae bacterium]